VSQYIQLRQDYDTRSGTSARMSDRFAPVRMGVAIVTQALLGGCSPVADAFRGARHYAADVSGKCRSFEPVNMV